MTNGRQNVAVFGGTFDPPHLGHLGVALEAILSKLVDEVWFIPTLSHRFEKLPVGFEDRVAMCERLVEGNDKLKVLTIERELSRPGFTLDLVRTLMSRFPRTSFRLLVGTDIFHERAKWHHWDEVAVLAPPLYVERVGIPPVPGPTLPAPMEISSTEVRRALALGDRNIDALPEAVFAYIDAKGLYRHRRDR